MTLSDGEPWRKCATTGCLALRCRIPRSRGTLRTHMTARSARCGTRGLLAGPMTTRRAPPRPRERAWPLTSARSARCFPGVAHLEEFITEIAKTEDRERGRKVLICVDEVDRIGSADEASKFLSEIKAIFGVPNCYFLVAIAEELGLSLSSGGISTRSVVDNAFDEIISLEPMSFESCQDLLTRRVPGFTESF